MGKGYIALAGLLLAVGLSGCGKVQDEKVEDSLLSREEVAEDVSEESHFEEEGKNPQEEIVVFTDALGREVTVAKPERVVTLLGSFCEEWILAGGEVIGTASDTFTNYDFGFEDRVTNIGSPMEPNLEIILSLNPDFVIASASLDFHVGLLESLENAGITVAYFSVNHFADYLDSLRIMTRITGREELYEENGTKALEEIELAKSQIDGRKPTVLLIRAAASSVKVRKSEGIVGGEILADLDTVNIADSNSLLEDLSMEAILLADPDYIFVTTQGSDTEAALANVDELLIQNPAWESLSAVQKNQYYVIDKALYNSKPNARWGEAYQLLADIIYPQE